MSITVLIASNNHYVRSGIRYELEGCNDITIAGEARCGEETLQLAFKLLPDVLLIDINIGGAEPVQIVSIIKTKDVGIKIIILADCSDQKLIFEMLKLGASGFISIDDQPECILESIQNVFNGKIWISNAIYTLLTRYVAVGDGDAGNDFLSSRQITILNLIGKGHSSKEIGRKLNISTRTVNYHVEQIFKKLGVKNRTEAVAYAIKLGHIKP